MNIDKLITLPHIKQFMASFASELEEFRIVGGAVRDLWLGRNIKDIDIATTYLPEEIIDLCEQKSVKAIATGLDYGTVTLVINGHPIEVTSLRKDLETDGRHAVVSYTKDYSLDAKRRDFTINALYLDFDGNISDFNQGREDLEQRKLRFIGQAEDRIKEDYLRILRLFRLYAELDNFKIDDNALKAAGELKSGLEQLSGERLHQEIFKLLDGKNYYLALEQMAKLGILDFVLPLTKEQLLSIENFSSENQENIGAIILLAFLLNGKDAKERLKLSSKEERQLAFLNKEPEEFNYDNELELKKSLVILGREESELNYLNLCLIRESIIDNKIKEKIRTIEKPAFPVNGDDLIKLGYQSGKELGEALSRLKKIWLESDLSLSKEALFKELKAEPSRK